MTKINYHVTSNFGIEIVKMNCPACEKVVFEMVDHELEKCVHCGQEFHGEIPGDYEDDKYTLILDPKTGIPSVIEDTEEM